MSFVDIQLDSNMSGKKMLQTYKRKRSSSLNGLAQGIEKNGLPLDGSETAVLSSLDTVCLKSESCDIQVGSTSVEKGGSTCLEGTACTVKATDFAVAQSPCSNSSNMERSESVEAVALNKASGLCQKMQVEQTQQATPLITFIRRSKRKKDSVVSVSNQDLGLSEISKLGLENHAATSKLSVDK